MVLRIESNACVEKVETGRSKIKFNHPLFTKPHIDGSQLCMLADKMTNWTVESWEPTKIFNLKLDWSPLYSTFSKDPIG